MPKKVTLLYQLARNDTYKSTTHLLYFLADTATNYRRRAFTHSADAHASDTPIIVT